MPQSDDLRNALAAIDWNSYVASFASDPAMVERVATCCGGIARWHRAMRDVEPEVPAISFLAEAQIQSHYIATLIPLAMYKSAAAAMRTIVESVLYYTYFRTHPVELASLVRVDDYHATKGEILDYHKMHSVHFPARQQAWGAVSLLNSWYSKISAVIHGQLPGKWVSHTDLAGLKPHGPTRDEALVEFESAVDISGRVLLCTMDTERWNAIERETRIALLKGVPGNIKALLDLPII